MLEKLKSRKYQAMIIGLIVGICTLVGVPDTTVKIIAAVLAAAAPLVYMLVEGHIDAKAVAGQGAETIQTIIKILMDAGIVNCNGDVAKIEEVVQTALLAARTEQVTADLSEETK